MNDLMLPMLLGVLLCPALFSAARAQTAKVLLLFGGEDHKTFLGCLNCPATYAGSVCNPYGKQGSAYQTDSIWDAYGPYGSEYSKYSPWNAYTISAPIIVDKDGNSYGYFSANEFHKDRTRIKWLLSILEFQASKDDLDATQKRMCPE
jgi:hypothetical protein